MIPIIQIIALITALNTSESSDLMALYKLLFNFNFYRTRSEYVHMRIKRCVISGWIPWTSQANTNVFQGQLYSATTLTACQAACITNGSCTGIDWDPNNPRGELCWFSGPWSGRRNDNGASGVTHYDLNRNCGGISYHYRSVLIKSDTIAKTINEQFIEWNWRVDEWQMVK